jgi:hypothetical protein
MRTFVTFSLVAALFTLASPASAQQRLQLAVGEAVDYRVSDKWTPCIVTTQLTAGSYGLHCGTVDLKAQADSKDLRLHIAPVGLALQTVDLKAGQAGDTRDEAVVGMPQGSTVGSRYGTREPRTCDNRKTPTVSEADAKDLFICDAEHEFAGSLYLVSDVSLQVATPRPFNPTADAAKAGIDPKTPVLDIHASYNNYQCNQLPSSAQDYPGIRNCSEFKMNDAAGSCYKNTAGEWHCLMYDFHPGAPATAVNVAPPTLTE